VWPGERSGRGDDSSARFARYCRMGVRTRGLDIAINAKRQVADAAARAEAKAVIERWNEQLVASRDILWSPTIRAALIAGTPWLDVFYPCCGTSRAIDLRTVDRPPPRVGRHAGAGTAVLVVPGIRAHAEDSRAACPATGRKCCGVEPVSQNATGTARLPARDRCRNQAAACRLSAGSGRSRSERRRNRHCLDY
jgi:hypothetical protein